MKLLKPVIQVFIINQLLTKIRHQLPQIEESKSMQKKRRVSEATKLYNLSTFDLKYRKQ